MGWVDGFEEALDIQENRGIGSRGLSSASIVSSPQKPQINLKGSRG